MRDRTSVALALTLACLTFAALGCGGDRLSDEELDRLAARVDGKVYPQLRDLVHQEFQLLRDELRRNAQPGAPAPTPAVTAGGQPADATPPGATTTGVPEGDWVLRIDDTFGLTKAGFEDLHQHKLKAQPAWRNLGRREALESVMNVELIARHAMAAGFHDTPETRRRVSNTLAADVLELLYRDGEAALPPLDEAALRAQYEKTKALYAQDAYLSVDVIEVTSRPAAEALRERLGKGEDFAALARQASVAPSAATGGSLGRLYPGSVDSDLYRFLEALPPGQVSEPRPTAAGRFALYRTTGRHEAAVKPFELVRLEVQRQLEERRREEVMSKLEAAAAKALGAEYHPEKLATAQPDDVLAKVGEVVLTRKQLDDTIQAMPEAQRGRFSSLEMRAQVLQNSYRRLLLFKHSFQDEEFKRRHGGFMNYLQSERLAQQYLQVNVTGAVQVGEADVLAAYESNKERLRSPAPYLRTSHVFYPADPVTDVGFDAARLRAEAGLARLRGGVAFAVVATEESKDHLSRAAGGESGWHTQGARDPAYYDAARSLAPGQVATGPVRAADGFYLLKLEERSDYRPLVVVRAALTDQLKADLGRQKLQQLVDQCRAKHKVLFRPEALEEGSAAASTAPSTGAGAPTTGAPGTGTRRLAFKLERGPDGQLRAVPEGNGSGPQVKLETVSGPSATPAPAASATPAATPAPKPAGATKGSGKRRGAKGSGK